MAQMWQPKQTTTLRYWVETILLEASDTLTEWETTFVDDIQKRLDLGRKLTQAQEEKLEAIYAAKTK